MTRWRRIGAIVLAVAAMAALLAGGQILSRWQPAPKLEEGWTIIRPPHETSVLAEDGDRIWAGGQEGVVALDRTTGKIVQTLDLEPPLEQVRALLVDADGGLWIGHHEGLTFFDGASARTWTEAEGLPDRRVNALMRDRDGRLWAGTWGGAAVYDGQTWAGLAAEDGLAHDMVNVLLQDEAGGIWFGSYVAPQGGISHLHGGGWQQWSTGNGLPHNNVTSLLKDASGAVWAGMGLLDRGGAVRFHNTGENWAIGQTLGQQDGLAGAKVRSIFQTEDGVLWFGSEYDGLTRWDGTDWTVYTEADGLAAAEVKIMLQDAGGNLWLGSTDGVTRIDAGALQALGAGAP